MPFLSSYARVRKLDHFFWEVPRDARILEIGAGDGWLVEALRARGFTRYTGLDLRPPADVVGDVNEWRAAGLAYALAYLVISVSAEFRYLYWTALSAPAALLALLGGPCGAPPTATGLPRSGSRAARSAAPTADR